MSVEELARASLQEISRRLLSKEISSVELTEALLHKIESEDDKIGSFLTLDREGALKSAQMSDARIQHNERLSELDGVPVALKDMILTKGLETTAASRILEGYIPPYDATVAEKLRQDGAIILGKLNQDEFAMGSSTETSAFKVCRNPVDLERTPGGSSGGSAASVSANFCYGSLGTDTGGSIRQPASFCGVAGIKPTYGRVSRYGVVAFASSLDQVGPFARDIYGLSVMLKSIAGFDSRDSTSLNVPVPDYPSLLTGQIRGLRVGVPKEYLQFGLEDDILQCLKQNLEILKQEGAEIVDISLPHTEHAVATYYIIATAEASSNLARYDGVRFGPRLMGEGGLKSLYNHTRGQLFGDEVKRRILLGAYVLSAGYYDAYYLRAQKVRRLFADDFKKAFENVDVILGPTTPTVAFKLGERVDDAMKMYLNDIYTISANLAGLPALSVNAGRSKEGLPIGIQLIGRPLEETTLLNAAYAIEMNV